MYCVATTRRVHYNKVTAKITTFMRRIEHDIDIHIAQRKGDLRLVGLWQPYKSGLARDLPTLLKEGVCQQFLLLTVSTTNLRWIFKR